MAIIKKKSIGLSLEPLLKVSNDKFIQIKLTKLVPGKYQPRKTFTTEELGDLSASIKENGIIQPLLVREFGENYEIIAGERRWRAAKIAGLQHVPAIVSKITDEQALAYGIVENLQRQDLNPIDEAEALQRLIDEFGMTHEEVSKSVGKSRTSVSNSLRLLNLSPFVKECLAGNKIQAGHAKPMITMDFAQQDKFCSEIIENQFSVRETEKRSKNTKPVVKKTTLVHPDLEKWRKTMSHILEMKVDFDVNELGAGKITIHVKDAFQIEQLIESMS